MKFFGAIGHAIIEFFSYTGAIMRLSMRFFSVLFRTKPAGGVLSTMWYWPEVCPYCVILFFVGLVFAFQLTLQTMGHSVFGQGY